MGMSVGAIVLLIVLVIVAVWSNDDAAELGPLPEAGVREPVGVQDLPSAPDSPSTPEGPAVPPDILVDPDDDLSAVVAAAPVGSTFRIASGIHYPQGVVVRDGDTFLGRSRRESDARRICGLPPIYLTLKLLKGARGESFGYDQCPADADGGSVVSIAGVLLYEPS